MGDVSYTMVGRVAKLRVVESRGLTESAQQVKEAIRHAAASGVEAMLVDVSTISVGPPTIAERHWIMTEWASVGRGAVRVAVVIRPEFSDPDKFGTAVATSRGLDLRGFTSETEALAWLLDE